MRRYLNFFNKNNYQLDAIFNWLSGVVSQNDLILLEREGKRESYYFEFPLKFGDKPKRAKTFDKNDIAFLIKLFPFKSDLDKNEWFPIFQSPELEIYENKKRFAGKHFKPLRWGLNEEEKRIALKIARESIWIFLEEKRVAQIKDFNFSLPDVFAVTTDLDVALWVSGAFRGSIVLESMSLAEGIAQAAAYVCRDARFKPLELEELEDARIEITLISDLKIPLSGNMIDKDEIFYDKGYLLKKGEKQGWFLPEVFNILLFKNLKEFLSHLALEKASLTFEEIFDKKTCLRRQAEIFIFEVDDFIEGKEKEEILNLIGPVAQVRKSEGEIKNSAIAAAEWLLKIQEPDGNFIPIINPITGKTSQLDWPRSIFTGWSLIEFGKTIGNSQYIEAGRKNFSYGKKYILDEQIIKNSNKEGLNLSYLGQAALSLGYPNEALQCGNRILEKENQLKFEPILFSQIGSFLAELSGIDKNFMASALQFGEKVQLEFDNSLRQKWPMPPAVWAELTNLNLKLFEVQGNSSYLHRVRKVSDWLLNHQLDDGSFRAIVDNNSNPVAYTRGTAKVAEALAGIFILKKQIDGAPDLVYYKKCLEKSFDWLIMMQYSPENSLFIPRKNLELSIGGFRHDYFNQEVWIDSAGHFLLAVSRFFNHSNS